MRINFNLFQPLNNPFLKICFLTLVTSVSTWARSDSNLGTEKNPIQFSLVPGQDVDVLKSKGEILKNYLEQKTGFKFNITVPFNFISVVETFGSKRTDMAMINSFGYLLAHEKYAVESRLIGESNGKIEYWGQIITAKPDIQKLEDLNGKKFAYVDPASTSGFILPSSLLKKKNINLKEFIFVGKHDSVVVAVYLGQVDAGASFNTPEENGEPQDARRLVKTQFPDVYKKVRILELTGPIPSDPVAFRKDFPPDKEKKIIEALIHFSKTPNGPATLKALYNIDGFQLVKDSAYDPLRKMISGIGKKADDFIK